MVMLEELWKKIQTLREDNLTEAENKLQLTAYMTMTDEMFKAMMIFMNDIQDEIKGLKAEQMKLIALQDEYIKTSGNTIDKLVMKSFEDVKTDYLELTQSALLKSITHYNSCVKGMESVAQKCTQTAQKAQEANQMLCRVDNFWKFLTFTASLYVIVDIVLRIILR